MALDNGKKNGQMTALVYLSRHYPHYDYDLYDYERDGKLKDIFSFIKEGRIVGGESLLTIRKGNRKITFFPHTPEEATFSDNRQNVCVLYPDNQLVWIVESRQVEKIFTDQQIKERYEKIQGSLLNLTIPLFKEMKVVDLNHDGCDDYYRYFPWFSYSYLDQYFKIGKSGAGFDYIELYFPHSKKICKMEPHGLDYLTSDGKNYFLSNQCNLTELTQ